LDLQAACLLISGSGVRVPGGVPFLCPFSWGDDKCRWGLRPAAFDLVCGMCARLFRVCKAHLRSSPESMLLSLLSASCCMSESTWEGIQNQGRIRSFSIQNSLRPVAYAHIQRAGLVQMKVGMPAVPALPQPFGSIGPRFKGRANLLWPHVALSIRGFQRRILTPALFHSITLLQARIQWCFPAIPQSARVMIWSPRQSCSAVAIRSSLGQGCPILGVD